MSLKNKYRTFPAIKALSKWCYLFQSKNRYLYRVNKSFKNKFLFMAIIKPFRGLRPPHNLVSQVASRPYDVLNSEESRAEAAGNEK